MITEELPKYRKKGLKIKEKQGDHKVYSRK